MLTVLLLSFALHGLQQLESPLEAAILDRAEECHRIRASSWEDRRPPRAYLKRLLRIEKSYDVPEHLRGFLLASACWESGFNPNREGDHRFSKTGKPKAIGVFQQWPWVVTKYGIDRKDPIQSAHVQMQNWVAQVPKTRRYCGKRSTEVTWSIAQVRSVRGRIGKCLKRKILAKGLPFPLPRGQRVRKVLTRAEFTRCQRCGERSKHYKLFKRWRRSWSRLLGET